MPVIVKLELTLEELDVIMSGLDALRRPDTDVTTDVWFASTQVHAKLALAAKNA